MDLGGLGRQHPTPRESCAISLDGDAVEFDRAQDGVGGQRDQAALEGKAQHHQVGRDRIAGDRLRNLGEGLEVGARAQDGADRCHDLALAEVEVAVAHEVGDRGQVGVDDADRALRRAQRDAVLRGGDDAVGGDQKIGAAGDDPGRGDLVGVLREADVAQHRAAFLRETRHVEDHAGLALEVSRHAENRANRQHAGAADAGDRDVVGPLQPTLTSGAGSAAGSSASSLGARRRSLPPSIVTNDGQKPLRQE